MESIKKEFNECTKKMEKLIEERKFQLKELEDESKDLLKLETKWRKESNKILLETNFKDLYKKDNEQIRNAHLQKEIPDIFDDIEEKKFFVNFIKKNITMLDKEISFLDKKMNFMINITRE